MREAYDADNGGVELDVADTAELGGSSVDVPVEVELPCYVGEIHFF